MMITLVFEKKKREDDQLFNLSVMMITNKINFFPVAKLKTLIFELKHKIILRSEIKK